METMANSLRKLRNQHIFDASKPELFIYKNYHVEAFHDSEIKPTYRNIMRKVRNNLTTALNKFPMVLPNYVIVLLNNSYAHDPTFVDFEFKTILKRVMNDVGRLLASRKEQLPRKNQNLMLNTEVFVTRPLPKPAFTLSGDKSFKNARRNINSIIDKLSRTYNFKPLNIDEINCSQRILFEKNGELSDYGQERMWHSISEFIRVRDQHRLLALEKFTASKEDVGVQVSADDQPRNGLQCQDTSGWDERAANPRGNTEEYFTREGHHRGSDRERSNEAYRRFDYYHRSFDRDGYQGDEYQDKFY